jgi:AcrR family transcriptional regulator
MLNDISMSAARERVLQTAERLFMERGYAVVTLNDIAAALHMKKASLYYHVPGGKEDLYVEVMERNLYRHELGLSQAMGSAGPTLREQLTAAAEWLLSQPPVNLARLTRLDLPALESATAERLRLRAYQALLAPLAHIFATAHITRPDPQLLAGMFVFMMEAIHDAQVYSARPRAAMLDETLTMLLHGLQQT